MNLRLLAAAFLALALSAAAYAQDNPLEAQSPDTAAAPQTGPGMGMRVGPGMGRGVTGTVTEAAPDHFTVKTFRGETYTVHYSANTRFMKQQPGQGQRAGRRGGMGQGGPRMGMGGGNPPESIQASAIKSGDSIAAMGEIDSSAKSVGAVAVLLLDPERAKQMEQMEADYGKTWLMGKVTAIDGVQVTLLGSVDDQPHAFVADENTTFRERRAPITLADIKVGDMLRAEGAVKDGTFTATMVNVMPAPGAMPRLPRNGPPPQ